VNEELLSVPWVVKVLVLLWVLNTSWVTTSDEVGEAAADSGRGVPEDLSWTTVVHWGWPDSEDNVLSWEGTIVNKGLMLLHTGVEWHIVILAPATEWVEEEDWVGVTSLLELLTGVLEEENVTIVEWVSNLESVNSIGTSLLDLLRDLTWGISVLVKTIVELDLGEEAGGFTRDEPCTLLHDLSGSWVLGGEATEGTGADLLLSIGEESWLVNDGDDLVVPLEGDGGLTLESSLLLVRDVLDNWDGKEMSLAVLVSDGLHVHGLNELHFVHEASEWVGPTLRDGLEVLDGVHIQIHRWHLSSGGLLLSGWLGDERLVDHWLVLVSEDLLLLHVSHNEGNRLVEGHFTSVDVEVTVGWGLVWVRDTSEVLDLTGTGLLVETLNISLLANLEGGGDVALEELEVASSVESLGGISVLGVWGDEGDEDDDASHVEELGDLSNSADVFLSVLLREAEALVEASTDNITIEDEALGGVTSDSVNVLLEGLGKG